MVKLLNPVPGRKEPTMPGKKKAFELYTGELMIGQIYTPGEDDEALQLARQTVLLNDADLPSGVWIKREHHTRNPDGSKRIYVTFLAHEEIKAVRDANIFDREIITGGDYPPG